MTETPKILIIRFSSFGDIVQTMSVLKPLYNRFPKAEVHWLCRSDMQGLMSHNSFNLKVWPFERKKGLWGLIRLGLELREQGFTHVYDAHSNLRSFIISTLVKSFNNVSFLRRPKERLKRFFLFWLRLNKFPSPYKGMLSYLRPLTKWDIDPVAQLTQRWKFSPKLKDRVNELIEGSEIVIAPSAAWKMKTWPLDHWKELVMKMKSSSFVILGGPEDKFCEEIERLDPKRIKNLAGKLSLAESCYAIERAALTVSADTGLLHVADLFGKKAVALIGPTAFGYPTSLKVSVLERDLACRPCTKDGRGRCVQDVYQKCMVDITPEHVADKCHELMTLK